MASNKRWTEEDIAYLNEKYGTVSVEHMAKKLDRTVEAVISKIEKTNIPGAVQNSGLVSLRQVLYCILGYYDNNHIPDKLKELNCPMHGVKTKERIITCVNIDDFWKWLKNNQNIISFKNFEENSLGAEPEWVKIKRKNDINNYEPVKKWTEEDVAMLKLLLSQHKFTYEDICKKLGRTKIAVKSKISKLGIPDRPVY